MPFDPFTSIPVCNPWHPDNQPLTSNEKFQQELEWLLEKYPAEPLAVFISNGLKEFQAGQKALKIALNSSYGNDSKQEKLKL